MELMVKYDLAYYKSVRGILGRRVDGDEEGRKGIMLFVTTQE